MSDEHRGHPGGPVPGVLTGMLAGAQGLAREADPDDEGVAPVAYDP
ncbi:hypothetical protein [Actinoallomurus vinaceus]